MASSGLVRAGVFTAALVGAFVVALRTVLHSSQGYPEAGLATLTFGVICLAPVAVAIIGWRRDSGPMLVAASVLCSLLALLSVATLPYLIPAALLAAASIRSRWGATVVVAAAATTVLGVAAGFVLLIGPEERCVGTATSQTCGHIATTADALLALGLIAGGIGIAAGATRRPPDAQAQRDHHRVASAGNARVVRRAVTRDERLEPPIIGCDGAAADPRELDER